MNNRDANLKQILSCDVLVPSVVYATGCRLLVVALGARLQWGLWSVGCSAQGIHKEPMACTPSQPSSRALSRATCLLG